MPVSFGYALDGYRRLWRDKQGGMGSVMAAGVLMAAAAGAISVDLTHVRAEQKSLEMTADAAALAAATRLPDIRSARAAALTYVEKNMPSNQYGQVLLPEDVQIGQWDAKSGAFIVDENQTGGSAIRVTVRLAEANGNPIKTMFAAVFGFDGVDVSESAVAGRGGAPCVLALEASSKTTATVKQGASVTTDGCGVQVNASGSSALSIKNGASMLSGDICVSGRAAVKGTAAPDPREYCSGVPDPLIGLKPPSFGGCKDQDAEIEDSSEKLKPGVYCGGLLIDKDSDVTLSPGLYVIRDGSLRVRKGSTLTGDGVTIFLTGKGAELDFDKDTSINLSAPTIGDLAGVVIFQDRSSTATHKWSGRTETKLNGVVYMPTGTLKSDGENQMTPAKSCTVIIVNDLNVGTKSSISISLTDALCRQGLPDAYRRGVVLLQ